MHEARGLGTPTNVLGIEDQPAASYGSTAVLQTPPPEQAPLAHTSVQRLIGAMLMEGLLARLVHYFTAPSFDTEHSAGLWRLPCACHSWGLPCACTSTSDLVPSEYWILCGNPMLGPRRAFSKS